MSGLEWIIDAHGCDEAALRDVERLRRLFDRLIDELDLTPVAPAAWHVFPPPGGITGFVMLAESHLACHTFPEHRSMTINLFCCKPRPDWDFEAYLARHFQAGHVAVRRLAKLPAPHSVSRGNITWHRFESCYPTIPRNFPAVPGMPRTFGWRTSRAAISLGFRPRIPLDCRA